MLLPARYVSGRPAVISHSFHIHAARPAVELSAAQLLKTARAFAPARPAVRSARAACRAAAALGADACPAALHQGARGCFAPVHWLTFVPVKARQSARVLWAAELEAQGRAAAGAEAGRRQALQLAAAAAAAAVFPGSARAAKGARPPHCAWRRLSGPATAAALTLDTGKGGEEGAPHSPPGARRHRPLAPSRAHARTRLPEHMCAPLTRSSARARGPLLEPVSGAFSGA